RHRERLVLLADAGRGLSKVDELPIVAIGQRPKQCPSQHSEHRRVGADAEAEGDDHRGGEPWRAAQAAKREGETARELLERARATRVAHLFLLIRNSAEAPYRCFARVSGRHASADVLLGLAIDVIAHLVVELTLDVVAAK